jgi:hypothetical protein
MKRGRRSCWAKETVRAMGDELVDLAGDEYSPHQQ